MQVQKRLEADIRYLQKVSGSGAYTLTELADKLLPEVPSTEYLVPAHVL